jgi:hypothetical protein
LPGRSISKKEICSEDYDSTLIRYANDFTPKAIELNKTLSDGLASFLLKIDTNCLRQQKAYEKFIAIILSKLYYCNLKCCNQSYDLLFMKKGAARILIGEYERMAGYENQHLEMLSSSTIVGFIKKKPELADDVFVKEILVKIENEERRISKGNI